VRFHSHHLSFSLPHTPTLSLSLRNDRGLEKKLAAELASYTKSTLPFKNTRGHLKPFEGFLGIRRDYKKTHLYLSEKHLRGFVGDLRPWVLAGGLREPELGVLQG